MVKGGNNNPTIIYTYSNLYLKDRQNAVYSEQTVSQSLRSLSLYMITSRFFICVLRRTSPVREVVDVVDTRA